MIIRFAKEEELSLVNELRKQVNDLHVKGRPDIFRSGFQKELQDYIDTIWKDPEQDILVAEEDGVICGFAVLRHFIKAETPATYEREFIHVEEFCVDEGYRRKGIASEMVEFIRQYTKEKGISRIELDLWEFNADALAFYEAMGFQTYRRLMELKV